MPVFNRDTTNRRCHLCHQMGQNRDMVQVKKQRLAILKRWYPDDVKTTRDHVHRRCLAQLGLYPFPTDVDLGKIIGDRLQERIRALAAELPDHRGPMPLVRAVFDRLCAEVRVPTAEGRRHLRYMVAHWVTTRLPDGRGGVSAATDPVAPLETADVLEVLDPTCRPADWLSAAGVAGPPATDAASNGLKPQDFAGMGEDLVRQWLSLRNKEVDVHLRLQRDRLEFEERMLRLRLEEARINQEPDRLRAEAELERIRRSPGADVGAGPPVADADGAPAAKRRRRCGGGGPTPLEDARWYRGRHSVGHAAYDRLTADADPPPDLRRVCALVAEWIAAQAARCPPRARPDVLPRRPPHGGDDAPLLLYAFPLPHPRAYVPEAALLDHVRGRLCAPPARCDDRPAAPPPPR